MLREVLIEIDNGCSSVCELSEKLGIEKGVLVGQLQTLIEQGYLAVQEKQRCEVCSKGCSGCGMAEDQNAGVTLFITEKGKKLIEESP